MILYFRRENFIKKKSEQRKTKEKTEDTFRFETVIL